MIKMLHIVFFLMVLYGDVRGMERKEATAKAFEPIVFVTEITNNSMGDYVIFYKEPEQKFDCAISLIRPKQTLYLNKRLAGSLKHYGEIVSWDLRGISIKSSEKNMPYTLVKCYVTMNKISKTLKSSTFFSMLNGVVVKDKLIPPLEITEPDESDKDKITYHHFDEEHDEYHINIQINLAGNNLEKSTLEVAHILQAKDLYKNMP